MTVRIHERCAFIDLEAVDKERIYQIGAVCGDRTFHRRGPARIEQALRELDEFVDQADFVVGHNVLRHDLPILQKRCPELKLLRQPVIDTLYLSPIAFPENPYHRLVKDYKLVHDSMNDPVRDAGQCVVLLTDEWNTLQKLSAECPEIVSFYRYCFSAPPRNLYGIRCMTGFFDEIGTGRINTFEALDILLKATQRCCCSVAAQRIFPDHLLKKDERWMWAYCLAWLRVAGGDSVLPPWVRHEFPQISTILNQLREHPCDDDSCEYCRNTHSPRLLLKQFFDFDNFRPTPKNEAGQSLQEDIVRTGLREESLLAVLPTGGGKSLCYQLPALARYLRRGKLTVVISPLQALMKDQVDNLVAKTGTPFAGAIYGLLTPPERGETLERIRLGNIAVVYVSPEQLRNKSFRETIKSREIGCWVFDEAHCLSKWGHDFRPDYLYAGRFIREFANDSGQPIPPVCCYTATAKQDVIDEIIDFFKNELDLQFRTFLGGVERQNLSYSVEIVNAAQKLERIHEFLKHELEEDADGAAVVFRITRRAAEETAKYLVARGWECQHFHAGLKSPEKRAIQESFINGGIRIICATNAFGMGIDKANVRVVLHGDTPGSLENYLQEAGRAGRDAKPARCILLFDEEDLEKQFELGAYSRLSRRDIAQILRAVRHAAKQRRKNEVVLTTGEILRDEAIELDFDAADSMADTKLKTAVSWLERGGYVQRNENRTQVFQGRPLVKSLDEAEKQLAKLQLPAARHDLYLAILRRLFNTSDDDGLTADDFAQLPEFKNCFPPEKYAHRRANGWSETGEVMRILHSMSERGLVESGLLMTAFVRHKVKQPSREEFLRICRLDEALIDTLQLCEPEAELDQWLELSLRRLNQRLNDDGHESSPETVLTLLKSLSMDGKGLAGAKGSLVLQFRTRDRYRAKLNRSWDKLKETAERRRRVAQLVLDSLLAKVPKDAPPSASIMISFSAEELIQTVQGDMLAAAGLNDPLAAVDRALLFLHEHHIIILQQGLAVFRQAMTIKLNPQGRGRQYTREDFKPLEQHYDERTFQVHVMDKYARLGIQKIKEALHLVNCYFTMPKAAFVRDFFAENKRMLRHATTVESFQRIVDELNNPSQQQIVTAPLDQNMLVLAGPGSGKTRVVAHRCAYLVKVERINPHNILVVCFNRNAALELRRRVKELIGRAANAVTIQTYHGLAMRLLGRTFENSAEKQLRDADLDFDGMIDQAVALLNGEIDIPGLADEPVRDRLLTGYEHVLVDEYQDIDARQYELISAITGRTLADSDRKLTVMAVGDDDQNIYTFRGANIQYIRRFRKDYDAQIRYLVQNYRSTANIIGVTNDCIRHNRDRMKTEYSIRINEKRQADLPGGVWENLDPANRGRVQLCRVADAQQQAFAVVEELKRLNSLATDWSWSECAVLARTRDELHAMYAALEQAEIPTSLVLDREKTPPLLRIREIAQFLDHLKSRCSEICCASELRAEARSKTSDTQNLHNPWLKLLLTVLDEWEKETGNAELPVAEAREFFYESLLDRRNNCRIGDGILVTTIHAAKGLEFDHVFIPGGGWSRDRNKLESEEERRVFYVGMTRARHTLHVFRRADCDHPFARQLAQSDFVIENSPPHRSGASYTCSDSEQHFLGMRDLFLDYASRWPDGHAVHQELRELRCGDKLYLKRSRECVELRTSRNITVALLSRAASKEWDDRLDAVKDVSAFALVQRSANDCRQDEYRATCKVDQWEVPLCKIVLDRQLAEEQELKIAAESAAKYET